MRAHGALSEIPEAGTSDHVCWVYDDDAAFDRALADFLSGGVERGEWLLCVGEQLCDLVQLRSSDRGTVVRVVTWL